MHPFLERHADDVLGMLSGFDRLRLRGTLRRVANVQGMATFLGRQGVLLKDFGEYVQDATAQRVKAGGGHILEGPTESPAGSWIIRCTDPQGAVFALEGTRRGRPVGYFARAASRGSSGAPSRR